MGKRCLRNLVSGDGYQRRVGRRTRLRARGVASTKDMTSSPKPLQGLTTPPRDAAEQVKLSPAPMWANLVATFFGAGRLHPGPGTWGSAVTVLMWWGLTRWIPVTWQTQSAILLSLLVILIGIPAA